jgi:hypothetical protein
MSEERPFDLEAYIKANPWKGPFVPRMHVVWDGDSVEYYAHNVPCYTEQIDANLWVYRAMDSHEVIGVIVHGLKDALARRESTFDSSGGGDGEAAEVL